MSLYSPRYSGTSTGMLLAELKVLNGEGALIRLVMATPAMGNVA